MIGCGSGTETQKPTASKPVSKVKAQSKAAPPAKKLTAKEKAVKKAEYQRKIKHHAAKEEKYKQKGDKKRQRQWRILKNRYKKKLKKLAIQ